MKKEEEEKEDEGGREGMKEVISENEVYSVFEVCVCVIFIIKSFVF
jgi:hypothetical protein